MQFTGNLLYQAYLVEKTNGIQSSSTSGADGPGLLQHADSSFHQPPSPIQAEDVLNNSAGAGAQPTGEVVAIVARGVGEIVATIAEEDERALMAKKDMGRQVCLSEPGCLVKAHLSASWAANLVPFREPAVCQELLSDQYTTLPAGQQQLLQFHCHIAVATSLIHAPPPPRLHAAMHAGGGAVHPAGPPPAQDPAALPPAAPHAGLPPGGAHRRLGALIALPAWAPAEGAGPCQRPHVSWGGAVIDLERGAGGEGARAAVQLPGRGTDGRV